MIVRLKDISLLVLFLFIGFFSMNAQKGVVHGKIVAFKNIPIEKAAITSKKTKTTVFSDSLGLFSIECVVNDKLSIKVAGFNTERIKVKNFDDAIFINLEFGGSENDIEEASKNGHIKKEKLIYATDYLDTEIFDDLGYTTALELISGKFPGVQIIDDEIRIRGIKSFTSSNAALIVINGVITSMSTLQGLHASDVKTIKVLKGTQAAIYGSRGANGAVLITTKGSRSN